MTIDHQDSAAAVQLLPASIFAAVNVSVVPYGMSDEKLLLN